MLLGQQALLFESIESVYDFLLGTAVIKPDGAFVLGIFGVVVEFTCVGVVPAAFTSAGVAGRVQWC